MKKSTRPAQSGLVEASYREILSLTFSLLCSEAQQNQPHRFPSLCSAWDSGHQLPVRSELRHVGLMADLGLVQSH